MVRDHEAAKVNDFNIRKILAASCADLNEWADKSLIAVDHSARAYGHP
ncbi:hypothetical protein AK973_3099 [Pseudomonas brassicacearum]|jgi:hypothetical protein|nr:hypothetical protein AK973_3099 [Pseudomonas brassicacearum]